MTNKDKPESNWSMPFEEHPRVQAALKLCFYFVVFSLVSYHIPSLDRFEFGVFFLLGSIFLEVVMIGERLKKSRA